MTSADEVLVWAKDAFCVRHLWKKHVVGGVRDQAAWDVAARIALAWQLLQLVEEECLAPDAQTETDRAFRLSMRVLLKKAKERLAA